MSISTRRGDDGETYLLGGRRVPKSHPRIAWVGTLDEAGAALGWARAVAGDAMLPEVVHGENDPVPPSWGAWLKHWQVQLVTAGGIAATPVGKSTFEPPPVVELDAWVARLESVLPPFRAFVMSGDTQLGAALDLARTAVRRAERAGWQVDRSGDTTDLTLLAWLNRLADVLWLLARLADQTTQAKAE